MATNNLVNIDQRKTKHLLVTSWRQHHHRARKPVVSNKLNHSTMYSKHCTDFVNILLIRSTFQDKQKPNKYVLVLWSISGYLQCLACSIYLEKKVKFHRDHSSSSISIQRHRTKPDDRESQFNHSGIEFYGFILASLVYRWDESRWKRAINLLQWSTKIAIQFYWIRTLIRLCSTLSSLSFSSCRTISTVSSTDASISKSENNENQSKT